MSPVSTPNPSARLLRAAQAERADLDRHRARLLAERDRLHCELERVEHDLALVDDRVALLDRLAPAPRPSRDDGVTAVATAERDHAPAGREVLRGPAIRETAVRVLVEQPELTDALHYRDWFQLVVDAGYEIAGKKPVAVFLTQLNRSPAVRRSTASGVYELDRRAGQRLRGELVRLQRELRELTSTPAETADLGEIRARRETVTATISQTERALEEAERQLGNENARVALVG
jgi:hypothetical protein